VTQRLRGYGLLTGNPFVDNGLAVIACLANCNQIGDLTMGKIRYVHGDGMKLARNNYKLRSTSSIFLDSMLTHPSPFFNKNSKRLSNYAKVTTAILRNAGHETLPESCDICGNTSSVDLDRLFNETFGRNGLADMQPQYIGRSWFPLAGSMGSDTQALPAASRSLNCCGKCLFAVQYLPQAVFSTKGRLTLFQSTSISFWYLLVKQFVVEISKRLSATTDKVETIGTKREKKNRDRGGTAIARMLAVMQEIEHLDSHASVTMWLFSNLQAGDCDRERIPNFALAFLYKAAHKFHLTDEISRLTNKEKSYHNSLLSCIINRVDYRALYPQRKLQYGASPELFMLYQTKILNYTVRSLQSAYKIAQYVRERTSDNDRIGIDIEKTVAKQVKVRELIVDMIAEEGDQITFDDYYDLFVDRDNIGSNPWLLVKYYLLAEVEPSRFISMVEEIENGIIQKQQYQDYKSRVISVGKAIYETNVRRRGITNFVRKVLGGLAHNQLHRKWLRDQFEALAEDNKEDFDLEANWKALCMKGQGEERGIYGLLYLWRLLWTEFIKADRCCISSVS
jgi:hypothetical protein